MVEKKSWTAKGSLTETDKAVVRELALNDQIASRILVTGEVSERYIGDAATRTLINLNTILVNSGSENEPLFVETRDDTIRMIRFDPQVVWRLFHPGLLEKLVKAESERLGFEWIPIDTFDFYESLVLHIRGEQGNSFPVIGAKPDMDTLYQVVYLGCMILFNKAGYMEVPASEHFALNETETFMRSVRYQKLSTVQETKLDCFKKEYGHLQGITNQELDFLVSLCEEIITTQKCK